MTADHAAALITETAAEVRRCCADLDAAEQCRLVEQIRREPSLAAQCRAIARIIHACAEAAHDEDVTDELKRNAWTMECCAEDAELAEDEAKREEHFAKQRELRIRQGEIV